jgi:predicted ester cyclase
MPNSDPKSVVLMMVERLWNGHDLDFADDLFGPDFDNGAGRPPGPEWVKEWHRSTRESFPDLRYVVDEIVAEGKRVALRWTATGTQRGQFGPIPPTGKVANYAGVHFLTVEDDRVTDLWSINDTFGKVLQLGAELLPPNPTTS